MLDAMISPTAPQILAETDAILFDFNGTLSNDEDLLQSCYAQALLELNYPALGVTEYEALLGRSEPDIAETLIRARSDKDIKAQTTLLIDAVARQYQTACQQVPRVSTATVFMIKELAKTHKLGIVTGTLRRLIEPVLSDLGIAEYFHTVITIEDVHKGKPAPEGFLLGAAHLHISPSKIMVFEDSAAGVAAAHAAGMKVIAVGPAAGLSEFLEKIEDFPHIAV